MVERSRIQGWHPESEFRLLIEKVADYINTPTTERKLLMALQADVQKLVDEVAANSSLVKSFEAGNAILANQITDLKNQVTALQAGQVLTAEDLAAIQTSVTTLGETNTSLQPAVPANTAPEQPPASSPEPPANP